MDTTKQYKGKIVNAVILGEGDLRWVCGNVYGHLTFRNGETIRTSKICKVEGNKIETLNSIYEVEWADLEKALVARVSLLGIKDIRLTPGDNWNNTPKEQKLEEIDKMVTAIESGEFDKVKNPEQEVHDLEKEVDEKIRALQELAVQHNVPASLQIGWSHFEVFLPEHVADTEMRDYLQTQGHSEGDWLSSSDMC